MSKCFFALNPSFEVRQQIIQARYNAKISGRLSRDENIHLTVLYLGKISLNQMQQIVNCAEQAKRVGFELLFNQINCFKRNNIVWMGSEQCPPELMQLREYLCECASQLQLKWDKQPFRPHITLARKAHLERKMTIRPIDWQVKYFDLLASEQQRDGVQYQIVKRFNLENPNSE